MSGEIETADGFRIGDLEVRCGRHVATMTIDRPKKLNALTAQFWGDMRQVLDRLEARADMRAVVITGAGDRAFSAGGDINGFLELRGKEEIRAYQRDAMDGFLHLERCPLTIIAAVNGLAFGGGCELVMACDIVVAARSAKFSLPEAALGLVPGFGVVRAPEVFGRQMAKYLIATGDSIDAQRALQIGFVQVLAEDEDLMAETMALAERVAARSPKALAAGKRIVNATMDATAVDLSIEEVARLQASSDRARGIEAFLERRTPVFGARQEA
jgi:enoyl-CoA hydratase